MMDLTHEQMLRIKDEIFTEADKRYVAIEECNDRQSSIAHDFAEDDKRIAIIAHDFNVIKKLMWALVTASIGSFVTTVVEFLAR